MPTPLLIGSCEPFSGKSVLLIGLARQLLQRGVDLAVGKPLATELAEAGTLVDADVRFIGTTLGLAADRQLCSQQLSDGDASLAQLLQGNPAPETGLGELRRQLADADSQVVLLETASDLQEGLLQGLDLPHLAQGLDAPVLLVHLWSDGRSADQLLAARQQLGNRLVGVVLNGVDPDQLADLRLRLEPALERLGLPVLGILPRSPLLRSVTVAELVRRLRATVLCCHDSTELLVESLTIGAMNVNAAMEVFRRRRNMAVVTGADRTDIQLAALEASTQCLILTGAGDPLPQLVNRAEELEVPLLKVDQDTLGTVEVIEAAFGHVRLHEPVKATHAIRLVEEHCRFERLFARLGLSPAP
ncbi:MAG: phosphotransacetylase family protein [Cyanobacteriota bacterium]|jgi:BioD-like phosphotransacetylase family protein|nr:phosphotransacetylase family protein [Cyanobacteriota bacterium]